LTESLPLGKNNARFLTIIGWLQIIYMAPVIVIFPCFLLLKTSNPVIIFLKTAAIITNNIYEVHGVNMLLIVEGFALTLQSRIGEVGKNKHVPEFLSKVLNIERIR